MTSSLQSYVFDWKPDYPLAITAKRYLDSSNVPEGYTLILAHGTGFHKEQWEPTIKHLFAFSKNAFPIREVWSVDCPNHGDAAIVNEDLLLREEYEIFSWDHYTRSLYLFLTQNPKIDFSNHKFIGIGHSMGAVCLSMTQTYPDPPKFYSLVLCEPIILPTDMTLSPRIAKSITSWPSVTEKRRDIWSSLEDVASDLSARRSFRIYDPEVLKAYIEHGFRLLPTALYPDKEGVTLKCSKTQEAACYRGSADTNRRLYDFFPTLTTRLPVHVIWGEINDTLDNDIKNRVTDRTAGRNFATVVRVKGAGHLVRVFYFIFAGSFIILIDLFFFLYKIIQMVPKGLAEAIISTLSSKQTILVKL
ncbi:hypothetical protein M422DRAFT_213426 [Sphaerobolus stellatus SS14]|uniref:AB hydrolase-1 domain-containing protein n=1 Tax=Sphaerobolus stellatus (strain SS14) TaxID=990650 RepID=A0A0C9TTD8_SPHS4|nr:hypothetical protein M422DRAFT_213426 [Sphaerobolus stellatus SS14]